MTDVSIIIVNYNTCEVTQNCIESIFTYTKNIDFEVILVDNNSNDDSFKVFSKDRRIKYIYLTENLGFGKANNNGYKYCTGKYIFLLNSDTIIKSNAVKEFYDYMESESSEIACTGTLLMDENNNIIHSYGKFPNLWIGLQRYSIIGTLLNLFKLHYNDNKIDYITGADLFIRRDVIEKYGLFDPDFFMYYEESEMQFRYKKNGYLCTIYDIPKIIHLENYSMNISHKSNSLRKNRIALISFYLYLKKCKGAFYYFLFRFIYMFISPLLLIHPKYSFKDKISFIKTAYLYI